MKEKPERSGKPVILMVTNNYTPYSGGVVSSIQVTAAELRAVGYPVVIVTLDFLGTGSEEPDLVRIPCFARFRWHTNYMAIPWRPSAALEALVSAYKPAIIHIHHPFLLGKYAQKIAQKHKIPVVFTFHTLYEKYVHYIPLPRRIVISLVRYRVKHICRKIDAIVSPSNSVRDYVQANFGCVSQVVPSALLQEFRMAALPEKKIAGRIELVSVSRFAPEKNIVFLLEMFAQLDERYRLTLIGYGAHVAFLQDYAYRVVGLPPERVQFIIKPEKNVIAQWYQQAHLFLFASQSETQGLVLAEAMAAGTPVIALRGPGVVDIVEDGANGYLVDTQAAMVQRITSMVHDAALYQHLRTGAHATAKNYYPEILIKKLCAVYEKLTRVAR